MWHVEINESEWKHKNLSLTIYIEESLFSKYLNERRELYPTYLKCNKNWFTPHNPYQPYLTPFPEEGGQKIRINETMKLLLPSYFVRAYKNKYEENVVYILLNWLEDEYKLYQKDWLQKTNLDVSS